MARLATFSRAVRNLNISRVLSLKGLRSRRDDSRAIGESPALVGYLTMAMKIAPNLERAVSFASEQLEGDLGKDLRRKTSEGLIRIHSNADEGLSKFAKRWGKACPELDRSIYLVRSSVDEGAIENRDRTLDRALHLSLQGARNRMRSFASSIYLPTLMIYSLGVLLPLVLVAILPVLSVIDISIGLGHLIFIYCILLPLLIYAMSNEVLSRRPAALSPPRIPAAPCSYRTLLTSLAMAAPIPMIGFILKAPDDISALLALWGVVLGISSYLYLTTAQAFKRRSEIIEMEGEFCDALVQLGNRVSEGRPAEEAFEHVAKTTKGGRIGKVLQSASMNIRLGGMGLQAALFDETRGALRDVHSSMIRGTLKMLTSLIEKSTRAAGEAILNVAEHLRELRDVDAEIRKSMSEVVISMRSVALFFAPLVTSISARMQGVLSSKVASTGFLGSVEVSHPAFLLVLGIYIVILAAILTNYSVEIEIGKDHLAKHAAMASAMPIALGVFTVGAILGGQMLGTILGNV